MPLDRLARDPLYNFLGVNLRADNLSMADGDLARIINADLHFKPGVVLLRKGYTHLNQVALGNTVRQIARRNGYLYQVAGANLYREFTSILAGFSAARIVSLNSYRPLNDTMSWTFIAQHTQMRKDNGTTVYLWGIEPPDDAPVQANGAAGTLTGVYKSVYTYARVVDGNVAHESNPSPEVTVGTTLTSDRLDVTVVASTDAQVTHIRLYRTLAGGVLYLFDQQVANTSATLVSSQDDTELGAQVEFDNDVPPLLGYVAEYQSHFFGVGDVDHPDYLWYAKRFRPESWPSNQFLRIGTDDDPLQAAVRMAGFLGVFSLRSKYRVSGNSVSGFAWAEVLNTRGALAPQAILATSTGVVFWAKDGIFLTNFLQGETETTAKIAPLFEPGAYNGLASIDFTQTAAFSLAEYKRRLYAGYIDTQGQPMIAVYSQDTQHWYHYKLPVASLYYDEQDDDLLMGTPGGFVAILETGTTDDGGTVSLDAQTRTMAGADRLVRKIFKFLKLDVEAVGAGGTVTLRIDGTVLQVFQVTAATRVLLRTPQRLRDVQGYSWDLLIVGEVLVYGAQVLYSVFEDV